MVIKEFPDVERADKQGLLCLGGDLAPESLLLAYSSGIFPWPLSRRHLAWFSPPRRTVLMLDQMHIPKSLKKAQNRSRWTFKFDTRFEEVIQACAQAQNRKGQSGTWITPAMIKAYCEFHRLGYAHSVECYEGEDLVGGLYGVSIGRMFAGESMFHRKTDASKLSLLRLLELLQSQEVGWIDCQVMTPLFQQLGAREISRASFSKLLKEALNSPVSIDFKCR